MSLTERNTGELWPREETGRGQWTPGIWGGKIGSVGKYGHTYVLCITGKNKPENDLCVDVMPAFHHSFNVSLSLTTYIFIDNYQIQAPGRKIGQDEMSSTAVCVWIDTSVRAAAAVQKRSAHAGSVDEASLLWRESIKSPKPSILNRYLLIVSAGPVPAEGFKSSSCSRVFL